MTFRKHKSVTGLTIYKMRGCMYEVIQTGQVYTVGGKIFKDYALACHRAVFLHNKDLKAAQKLVLKYKIIGEA